MNFPAISGADIHSILQRFLHAKHPVAIISNFNKCINSKMRKSKWQQGKLKKKKHEISSDDQRINDMKMFKSIIYAVEFNLHCRQWIWLLGSAQLIRSACYHLSVRWKFLSIECCAETACIRSSKIAHLVFEAAQQLVRVENVKLILDRIGLCVVCCSYRSSPQATRV